MARKSVTALPIVPSIEIANEDAPLGPIETTITGPQIPTPGPVKTMILPPLPDKPQVMIKNRSNASWYIPSGDKDVEDIFLGPMREDPLPRADFWLLHERFRSLVADPESEDPEVRDAPLAVYETPRKPRRLRAVPAESRAREEFKPQVETICFADFDTVANEYITLTPMAGDEEKRLDVRFLDESWRKVLEHARFILLDRRRAGYEVDQRRIDAIEQRIAEIQETAIAAGIRRVIR